MISYRIRFLVYVCSMAVFYFFTDTSTLLFVAFLLAIAEINYLFGKLNEKESGK